MPGILIFLFRRNLQSDIFGLMEQYIIDRNSLLLYNDDLGDITWSLGKTSKSSTNCFCHWLDNDFAIAHYKGM